MVVIDELREQVSGLQAQLGKLSEQLQAPGAKRLKGLQLAKLVVSLDQVGTKLGKAARELGKAAGNGDAQE
jgi:hypothetical protein